MPLCSHPLVIHSQFSFLNGVLEVLTPLGLASFASSFLSALQIFLDAVSGISALPLVMIFSKVASAGF